MKVMSYPIGFKLAALSGGGSIRGANGSKRRGHLQYSNWSTSVWMKKPSTEGFCHRFCGNSGESRSVNRLEQN